MPVSQVWQLRYAVLGFDHRLLWLIFHLTSPHVRHNEQKLTSGKQIFFLLSDCQCMHRCLKSDRCKWIDCIGHALEAVWEDNEHTGISKTCSVVFLSHAVPCSSCQLSECIIRSKQVSTGVKQDWINHLLTASFVTTVCIYMAQVCLCGLLEYTNKAKIFFFIQSCWFIAAVGGHICERRPLLNTG